MKILVTGSNGFIGRILTGWMINNGHELYCLDIKDVGAFSGLGIKRFIEQDLAFPFRLPGHYDAVCHLAAYNVTHVGARESPLYQTVNVDGTRNVARALDADRFIFLSTTNVYAQSGGSISEASPVEPCNAYAASKLAGEKCLSEERKAYGGLTIFRCSNVIGPGQAPKALVPVLFERAWKCLPIEIFAPAATPCQLLDVEDVAWAFQKALESSNAEGLFNLAVDKVILLKDLAKEIIRITGSSSEINLTNDGQPNAGIISSAKAKSELGWYSRVSLEESLQRVNRAGAKRNS